MTEDPAPQIISRRFSMECGRLVLGEIRRAIREGAVRHNVDLELQEEKGWVDCMLFGRITGSKENVNTFVIALQQWSRRIADDS